MNRHDLEQMMIEIYAALDVITDKMEENGLMTEGEFRQLKAKAEEAEKELWIKRFYADPILPKITFTATDMQKGEER